MSVRRTVLATLATGLAVVSGLSVAVASCQPNLDDTVSIVSSARVLAIQSVPAEAPPMTPVTYTALVAGGPPDAGPPKLAWDYCNARNPLKNLGPASSRCVQPGNAALAPLGTGTAVTGSIPDLACGNFGPNAPPAVDGGMAGQPVDPDFTGGYYQPVSAFLPQAKGAADTLYFMRLSCGFAGANQASQGILTARYHPNENPTVASLTADGATLVPAASGSHPVAAGHKLALVVSWPSCPLVDRCGDGICGADESAMSCPADCAPKAAADAGAPAPTPGCAGAERFVNFDLTSQAVVDQREGIHVSWYATAGTFDQDRTGRSGTDSATSSSDAWTAPATTARVAMWVVLRDDRGGIGWAEYALDVR